ncbi:MAG: sensor histidine kinase [Dehalococcoidia bacterium]
MLTHETTTGTFLARMLVETRDEIRDEWLRLIRMEGLPHQQSRVREDPAAFAQRITVILDATAAYLGEPDPVRRQAAREALVDLYRGFGRAWAAEQGAAPALAIGAPRAMQAASRLLLTRYAARLQPDELLDCVTTLNALVMDLTMARVFGYLSAKEEALQEQRQTVGRLVDELAGVETKERRSLALELHDGLAQRLVSIYSGIQHAERLAPRDVAATRGELARLHVIARDTIRDARATIRDLHFGVTGQGGGFAALGDYMNDLEADSGVRHRFIVGGRPSALAPSREALVVRIIQEALVNAHKHAGATEVRVVVEHGDHELTVTITDDGVGFSVDEALARSRRRGRFGLIGMQERAQLLGATLQITSCKACGAMVRLVVPHEASHG